MRKILLGVVLAITLALTGCAIKSAPQIDLLVAQKYAENYMKDKYGVDVVTIQNDDKYHTMAGPTYYQGTFKLPNDESSFYVNVNFNNTVEPDGEYSVFSDTFMQRYVEMAGSLWIEEQMRGMEGVEFINIPYEFIYSLGDGYPSDYPIPHSSKEFYDAVSNYGTMNVGWHICIPERERNKIETIQSYVSDMLSGLTDNMWADVSICVFENDVYDHRTEKSFGEYSKEEIEIFKNSTPIDDNLPKE